jgi:hypothetical protein
VSAGCREDSTDVTGYHRARARSQLFFRGLLIPNSRRRRNGRLLERSGGKRCPTEPRRFPGDEGYIYRHNRVPDKDNRWFSLQVQLSKAEAPAPICFISWTCKCRTCATAAHARAKRELATTVRTSVDSHFCTVYIFLLLLLKYSQHPEFGVGQVGFSYPNAPSGELFLSVFFTTLVKQVPWFFYFLYFFLYKPLQLHI